uniref:PB1-like domain-containing protein n=1 Tax=Chenopodium quinoa TaxID=63459 RepID=A0A803LDX8_CHEQI
MDTTVTLKFWHGGVFIKEEKGLTYVGGEGITCEIDPDELCWWYTEELAKKGENYCKIEEVYYLMMTGLTLGKGLRRVYDDDEVRKMTAIAMKNRNLELYVVHGVSDLKCCQ